MATTSNVNTVAAALKTQLTTGLSSLGYEGTAPVVRHAYVHDAWDVAVIGDVVDGEHEIPNMRAGRKHRQEMYFQLVHFFAVRPGTEPDDAKTAALSYLAVLENLLANDVSLGITSNPTLVCAMERWNLNTTADESSRGWKAEITARVQVSGRLV